MTQHFDIYSLLLIISFLTYIFYRDDNTKKAKTQFVLNHPNIKESFTIFNEEDLQNHSSFTYDETDSSPIIPQEETNETPTYIYQETIDTPIIPEEAEDILEEEFKQIINNHRYKGIDDENKNNIDRDRDRDSDKDKDKDKDKDRDRDIPSPNESKASVGAPLDTSHFKLNYDTKKFYCNSYRNHKSLFPQTPADMILQTQKGIENYTFKDNDICCTSGDPKRNFKKDDVKCCSLSGIQHISPNNCNHSCI